MDGPQDWQEIRKVVRIRLVEPWYSAKTLWSASE